MNGFQKCPSTAELEPLFLPQQLYLRPISKLHISVQLPNLRKSGKSVSHWEIMDKLKDLIQPDEYTIIKVIKTTLEVIRFEAEVEKRAKIERVITKTHNRMIKLKDFAEVVRVKAAEAKSEFPTARMWDSFFEDAKNMNEMKPGERPDTMHLSNIPSKWFKPYHLQRNEDVSPSEKIFYKLFEKFGNIRYVDIPLCDPYRKKMNDQISGLKFSSFDKMEIFEGYVQFKDYIGFKEAMDTFRDKKLVHKNNHDEYTEMEIKVDFDKTKHLSDAAIRRREIVRDRLVRKAREKEEKDKEALEEKLKLEESERKKEENLKTQKEIRQRMREEKRKAKILEKLEITGSDEINEKIAREEKKLLKVQRKLEGVRLVEELFKRIKEKTIGTTQRYEIPDKRGAELKRLKNIRELDYLNQKEKLHNAVKGRAVLRTLLSDNVKRAKFSDSSESEISLEEREDHENKRAKAPIMHQHAQHPADLMYDGRPPMPQMYGLPYQPIYPSFGAPIYPDIDIFALYRGNNRGRGRGRGGRGYFRGRGGGGGNYSNGRENEEYSSRYHNRPSTRSDYHYEHDNRYRSRSYSPRSSRKRSYDRSSRSRSRSRSRRRSNRRYDRDSRSRSRSTYKRSRSRSKNRSRRVSRSERRSRSKSRRSERSSNHRRSKSKSHNKSRSPSKAKSVDSSKFMTPRQLLEQKQQEQPQIRSRSKSWSMPKEGESRSWSQSPGKSADVGEK